MTGRMTSCFTAISLLQCLLCLALKITAQKNGFRGGAKSYEIHVEANPVGTNLHYELPESKVKASSKQDWLVDNDNAEMLAMNSPVLATVDVKHPKFSMKGLWPGYKTSFKVPKNVNVASKRHDLFKSKYEKLKKLGQIAGISSGYQASEEQNVTGKEESAPSRKILSRIAGQRKPPLSTNEMLNFSRFLLPITRMKNIDMDNPHVSKAMKGVITHARKVVYEAKMVLNDAASFITRVRKLVKVTKHHRPPNEKEAKSGTVAEPTKETAPKGLEKIRLPKKDNRKTETSITLAVKAPNYEKHNRKEGNRNMLKKEQHIKSFKEMSKRSDVDSFKIEPAKEQEKQSGIKERGLPDTLESILHSISGLKRLLKYQ
ncbi:uncharacterized protein [Montipora capricornis]|uniref:uncharacterized protein n=1 Tax=Montipora capricornis TaxID=246305 RepID=UPI0035F199AF